MKDKTCLASNLIVDSDANVNNNTIIVGSTGSGKSVSYVYPKLLHTYNSSLIVPISKKEIMIKFSSIFKKRGYLVECMDFTNTANSTIAYDPLHYLNSTEEIINFSRNLVFTSEHHGNLEEYWYEAASQIITAEILLVKLNAEHSNQTPSFKDVLTLHNSLKLLGHEVANTNLDPFFSLAQRLYPSSQIRQHFSVMSGIGIRTASCIFSVVNNAYCNVFTEQVVRELSTDRNLDIDSFVNQKTILFILTPALNIAINPFINLFYSELFRKLFEYAENTPTGRLPTPIHFIFDDFAIGARVNNIGKYLSIVRSVGISLSLIIQSEAQLYNLYKREEGQTIIDNCDTYLYLGGNNTETAKSVAERLNKPIQYVLSLPAEQVIVFQRGFCPFEGRRYQTFSDEQYIKIFNERAKQQ